MKNSGKIVICGIFSALAIVCMLLTVIPIATYCIPAIAGMLLLPIAIEVGTTWGISAFIASSILSFFIVPDLESKIMFIMFFGYYPIVKLLIDKLSNQFLKWIIKLLIFNFSMIFSYWLLLEMLGLPKDSFEILGFNLPWIFLLVGNGIFVLLDIAIEKLIYLYMKRCHNVFLRIFK